MKLIDSLRDWWYSFELAPTESRLEQLAEAMAYCPPHLVGALEGEIAREIDRNRSALEDRFRRRG